MKLIKHGKKRIMDFTTAEGPAWRAAVYDDPRDGRVHVAPMLAVDAQAAVEMAVWWKTYLQERYSDVPIVGAGRAPGGVPHLPEGSA